MSKVFEVKKVDLKDFQDAPVGCAWAGCTESFEGEMPDGWNWLLMYNKPKPDLNLKDLASGYPTFRDAALCPVHSRELDNLLKAMPRWADVLGIIDNGEMN